MDVNRALRSAAQTGKVHLGLKQTVNAIEAKAAKLVVVSDNLPDEQTTKVTGLATANGVSVYRFRGANTELGPACGKPFSVAVLAVLDGGESDVLALARSK